MKKLNYLIMSVFLSVLALVFAVQTAMAQDLGGGAG